MFAQPVLQPEQDDRSGNPRGARGGREHVLAHLRKLDKHQSIRDPRLDHGTLQRRLDRATPKGRCNMELKAGIHEAQLVLSIEALGRETSMAWGAILAPKRVEIMDLQIVACASKTARSTAGTQLTMCLVPLNCT